jgi:hypothetical protein
MGPADTRKEDHMRRFVQLAAIMGLSTVQVVGMSTSGVASTSQHAAVQHRSVAVSRTEKPKPKPKIGNATQISQAETKEEQLGAKALQLVTFDWRTTLPGWTIRFLPARKGYLAMTYREDRRIEVYVRVDRPVGGVAHDIAHELGHAIDVTYLNDPTRDDLPKPRTTILRIRNLKPDTPWWACDACTDLETGAGDFAETFALLYAPRFKFYSELGNEPTPDMLRQVGAIVTGALQTN